MRSSHLPIGGVHLPCFACNTLIVGSGAAALNAAVRLHDFGQTDIAVVTDGWGAGTSNNTGSDKQTYYKLSLAGDLPDSPVEMARDLFDGGCMHGDIALCEALNSTSCFFHLVGMGVPFPHDRFGAYVGYKTDHDPRQRATSTGPLTSHAMFEALAGAVRARRIRVFDFHQVIAILTEDSDSGRKVIGALALDTGNLADDGMGMVVFNAPNLVLGTGGPAGMYRTSVYPESQTGCTGMAFAAGAAGQNLTESQFGLASIRFRWNLSGTYQQVIPRYFSTEPDGSGEKPFLNPFFPDSRTLATAIFLKGYQWPFDPRKVREYGSSLIDLLVDRERIRMGRRVFMDFTSNLTWEGKGEGFSLENLGPEARSYLGNSGALFGTPIQRLEKMNPPAVELFRRHNIDLAKEPLEIAVCAQHNNGGLKGNIWWESNLRGLFPVGEVNGSHGIYRPGGSALNAGQVGGLRAAIYIASRRRGDPPDDETFRRSAADSIREKLELGRRWISGPPREHETLEHERRIFQDRMAVCGSFIRPPDRVREAVAAAWEQVRRIREETGGVAARDLPYAFRNLDLCLTHAVYLDSIREYLDRGGLSRGSFLVPDPEGELPCPGLEEEWRFRLTSPEDFVNTRILEVSLGEDGLRKKWGEIRPIPREETWFENVWRDYRDHRIFQEEGSDGS